MKKITNEEVMKLLDKKPSTFYAWKKREPLAIEYIKKGIQYERLTKEP